MEANISNNTILSSTSDVVSKQRSAKRVINSLLAIIIGVAIIVTTTMVIPDSTSSTYMALMTIGIILVLIYGLKLLFGSSEMVYVPTKSPITNYALFFKSEELHKIVNALEMGNLSGLNNASKNNTSGVRLDVIMSKDNQFAACQVCKYIPHNYEPVSKVYHINGEQISVLQPLLKS